MADDIREFDADSTKGKIRFRILEMENGLMLLISDSDKFRIGLSAIAIPAGHGSSQPTSSGLFTSGLDAALVRTLAERIAIWTNQTCMIVAGLKSFDQSILMELTTILKNHLVT